MREPCEVALGGFPMGGTIEVDLHASPGIERVFFDRDARAMLVADARCTTVLSRLPVGVAPEDATGPTSSASPWANISEDQIRRWSSVDALPTGVRRMASELDIGGPRRALAVLSMGTFRSMQSGYVLTLVRCDDGPCRADALAHLEWFAPPGSGCIAMRAAFGRIHDHDDAEEALIQVEPTGDPARQILVQHYARFDRCARNVRTFAPVRRFEWTRAGVTRLADPATSP